LFFGIYANPFGEFPGKILFNEELGLLSVFAVSPVPSLNRVPVDFPKISQVRPILEVI
jgi:hypothetical protein